MKDVGFKFKDKFCLETASQVANFCNPLFQTTEIDYFCLVSIDKVTKKRFFLTNKAEWLKHFYENGYYSTNIIASSEKLETFSRYLWEDFLGETPFISGKHFGINNGITIFNPTNRVLNLYCFGSSQSKAGNYFVEGLSSLEYFINYFHTEAHSLIQDAKRHQFILPEEEEDKIIVTNAAQHFQALNERVKNNRFSIDNGCYLTQKEAICIYLLMHGNSSKQIANLLSLSWRTVETHVAAVRTKLACKNITGIISVIIKNNLLTRFFKYCELNLKSVERKENSYE